MSALLHSVEPSTVRPGDTITLHGEAFEPGLVVVYESAGTAVQDPNAAVLSLEEATSVVPDLLLGMPGSLLVSAFNTDEDPSNQVVLEVLASPAVQAPVELCSVGALKELMGVAPSETFDDGKLRRQIRIASAQIIAYCGRDFTEREFSETYDGDASPTLALRHTPILQVLALRINGIDVPAAEALVYPNWIKFRSEDGYDARLRSAGRIFPHGLQNIEVTYKAGYPQVPAEISDACMLQVMHLMNTGAKQGLVSETNQTSGVTIAFAQSQLAPAVRASCNKWRRTKIGMTS